MYVIDSETPVEDNLVFYGDTPEPVSFRFQPT